MIHLANYEERVGGGWSWSKTWIDANGQTPYDQSEIYLIPGPTMASYDDADKAKVDGKKLVLRVDNHVLASRNRNTGMSRMSYFAEKADLVIYQSNWARDYLKPFLNKDGPVVYNGVDTKRFNSDNRTNNDDYLYARSSRISEKGWEYARYHFSRVWQDNNSVKLNIVGKFSHDNIRYQFDFFQGERYQFWGERKDMEQMFKQSKNFLYSYFLEAGSNTLLEARASGCEIIDVMGALQTGCGPEYMEIKDLSKERMLKEYLSAITDIS